jgi:hypothetical protein
VFIYLVIVNLFIFNFGSFVSGGPSVKGVQRDTVSSTHDGTQQRLRGCPLFRGYANPISNRVARRRMANGEASGQWDTTVQRWSFLFVLREPRPASPSKQLVFVRPRETECACLLPFSPSQQQPNTPSFKHTYVLLPYTLVAATSCCVVVFRTFCYSQIE